MAKKAEREITSGDEIFLVYRIFEGNTRYLGGANHIIFPVYI